MSSTLLPCETIAFRGLSNRQQFQDGKVLAGAFLRRPPDASGKKRDIKGLSVNYDCDPTNPHPGMTFKAVASLHVGHVRTIESLDVVADSPTHANITNLPEHDDIAKAEHVASLLLEQCRLVARS